nr:DHHA1 domain-containing protein [uncultured Blautia sp.]
MYEEEENRWCCSFRFDGKWINVNELLQAFGGGGHAAAAGVRKRTNDVEKFRQEILERIVAMRKFSNQDK